MDALPIQCKQEVGFLEEEYRCSYLVSRKMKRIWAVELDLLKRFQDVCDKHDIKYQVTYGTLLGAVRHGGFIPWDDDMDIWLHRDEFEKLLRVASDEFKEPYFLQTALSDRKYFFPYARLRNSLTTGAVRGREGSDYNNGIYIDIYVLDGMAESKFAFAFQRTLQRLVFKGLRLHAQNEANVDSFSARLALKMRPLVRLIPMRLMYVLYRMIVSMYNNSAKRFTMVTYIDPASRREWITRDDLLNTVMKPFENLMVPVPKGYDGVLTRMYGEYMKFPPVEKRGKWHEGVICFDPDVPYKKYFERK